ncbi:hypothetical protein BDV06DRAFT_219041 [Aspergillus oleicola]
MAQIIDAPYDNSLENIGSATSYVWWCSMPLLDPLPAYALPQERHIPRFHHCAGYPSHHPRISNGPSSGHNVSWTLGGATKRPLLKTGPFGRESGKRFGWVETMSRWELYNVETYPTDIHDLREEQLEFLERLLTH